MFCQSLAHAVVFPMVKRRRDVPSSRKKLSPTNLARWDDSMILSVVTIIWIRGVVVCRNLNTILIKYTY
ncbi:hypothetical protein SADUNF_Sadunf09G0053700 [Salix dunnii]|uniref:Uncharacterized protein n=1 Tax=Salix dunnii TaxID=1413687 RepID=A0A835JSG3_9ROSI|nr:hypothetical protein SADUNF_Sadunf09G0053700 [Salix dunnii]